MTVYANTLAAVVFAKATPSDEMVSLVTAGLEASVSQIKVTSSPAFTRLSLPCGKTITGPAVERRQRETLKDSLSPSPPSSYLPPPPASTLSLAWTHHRLGTGTCTCIELTYDINTQSHSHPISTFSISHST